MLVFILVSFYLHATVVQGFFVKNCNIKAIPTHSTNFVALCNKQRLSTVPENLPHHIKGLDICQNNISKIKSNDLVYLSHLKYLNVSHNVLQEVEDGAFRSLEELQGLNLAFNRLTTIQGSFFQNLHNLTVLRLDKNSLRSISASAFVPLKSLVMVNLSGNHLQNIERLQPLFMLPKLMRVHIGSNGITSFQSLKISNTSLNLKALDLSWNPLQVFSLTQDVFPQLEMIDLAFINESMRWDVQDKNYLQNVFKLNLSGIHMATEDITAVLQMLNSSLTYLKIEYMGKIKAQSLIKAACRIDSLTVFRLQGNNLNSISDQEFRLCKQLTLLDLPRNNLISISSLAFSSLKNLSKLILCHNKLKSVPIAMRNISTLETIDLSYNSIKELKCVDFANLKKLSKLHIYRNPLHTVELCAFQNLNNLQSLIMSTEIFTLKGYFTSGVQKLELLDLSQNKLNSINKGDFRCLGYLRYLYLQDNQITYIEPGAFEGLTNLTVLSLQSNKITQSSIRLSVFSGLPNLLYLWLNNNYISYSTQTSLREPPFASLPHLEVLGIYSQHHKGMENIPLNFLEGLTSLNLLWAGSLGITSLHPHTFKHTPGLRFLDLSKNEFSLLSPEIFWPIKQLYRLVMVQTGLQSIDFLVPANLSEIRLLFVRHNAISVVNKTVIDFLSKLMYLDLQENAFSCDCTNAWFINWTINGKETQVLNADKFQCNYPVDLRGKKLMNLDVNSCSVDVGFICFISTSALVLLTLVTTFFYNFLKWQVIYTYYLFLSFLYDSKHQSKQETNGFQYDAFVSYNTHDEPWVMEELLSKLEGEQGWRLCLHHRDFQPGKPIVDNIVEGIYSSRKTICVISRHYLESEWCSREIQVASFRLFDEKKDVLILVFLEDIPNSELSPYYRMRRLIKKRTYLKWPKLGKDTQYFWQKLRAALETRGSSDENNSALQSAQ
ncbi:toll-like receptor 13 [Astyanax mexicanus]|uniref:Toll-like receptor 13 n=1 Tax=Astyanax mexicanus TaxID=7994 RepID=A0A8B9L064_ASTMX|nr:toll-like receptor 13 [Astyanax mexicanus]